MKLPPDIKAKWVAALRSGEFEQGTGTMCRDGKYCCLGVLQVVLDGDVERDGGLSRDIPSSAWAMAKGITSLDAVIGDDWYPMINGRELAVMNDDDGLTFAEIADLIEDQL